MREKEHLHALPDPTFPSHGMSVSYRGPMQTFYLVLSYSFIQHPELDMNSGVCGTLLADLS